MTLRVTNLFNNFSINPWSSSKKVKKGKFCNCWNLSSWCWSSNWQQSRHRNKNNLSHKVLSKNSRHTPDNYHTVLCNCWDTWVSPSKTGLFSTRTYWSCWMKICRNQFKTSSCCSKFCRFIWDSWSANSSSKWSQQRNFQKSLICLCSTIRTLFCWLSTSQRNWHRAEMWQSWSKCGTSGDSFSPCKGSIMLVSTG